MRHGPEIHGAILDDVPEEEFQVVPPDHLRGGRGIVGSQILRGEKRRFQTLATLFSKNSTPENKHRWGENLKISTRGRKRDSFESWWGDDGDGCSGGGFNSQSSCDGKGGRGKKKKKNKERKEGRKRKGEKEESYGFFPREISLSRTLRQAGGGKGCWLEKSGWVAVAPPLSIDAFLVMRVGEDFD